MTTSGTITYNLTRDEVIKSAFEFLEVYGADEEIDPADNNTALRWLNMMIKSWNRHGIPLWGYSIATLFLQKAQIRYQLGAIDHAADTVVETTLSAAAIALQTVLSITATTGMTAGDNIGIVLTSGYVHWTTIVSVDSSTQITITTGVVSAAASGNSVYSYTTRINRPMFIHDINRVDLSGNEISVDRYNRRQYFQVINKTSVGEIIAWYYDLQRITGFVNLWMSPQSTQTRLRINYTRSMEDAGQSTDNLDFPTEWLLPLTVNLSRWLAPVFGHSDKLVWLIPQAADELDKMLKYDNEGEAINLVVSEDL